MKIVMILMLVCEACTCRAQQLHDTMHVTVRHFAPEKLRAYRSDPAFQYEVASEPASSAWDYFWTWIWDKIDKIMHMPGGAVTVKTILVAGATVLLVIFVTKLAGMNRVGLFGKKNLGGTLEYTTSEENIFAINFNEALQAALEQKNFRMAIRLLYLQSLKKLADRQMIEWKVNKTNSTYVEELTELQQQRVFSHLTSQFETHWYGNQPVQEYDFYPLQQEFEQFNKQLG